MPDAPDALARRLASAAVIENHGAGAAMRAGADDRWIVLDGVVSERLADGRVRTAGPGQCVGMPTADGHPSALTADTDVTAARLPASALVPVPPADLTRVAQEVYEILRRRSLLASASAVFGPLTPAALAEIEQQLTWLSLKRGAVLIEQGDLADAIYILIAGRLGVVRREADGSSTVLGQVAPGESVGEMAFFTGEPRNATVYATRDSLLARCTNDGFERIVASNPGVLRQVTRIQIQRLRAATSRQPGSTRITNIAVLPVGSVDTAEFCRRLTEALAAWGPTVELTADGVGRAIGDADAADAADDTTASAVLLGWLREQELRFRFVVYRADLSRPAWTRRAIGQADRCLLLGDGRAAPQPSPLTGEQWTQSSGLAAARRTLVLLHPDGSRLPSGTGRWLDRLDVAEHYHLRLDAPDDMARLARMLAGRAVGLALGGGGARALAHIGVFRALTEQRLPIDIIGGTSIGAAMSAQFAMGWTWDQLVEENRRVFVRERIHRDFTLPVLSLTGDRAERSARLLYGDTQVEDLWLPYFSVSSDLTTAARRVHRRGPVWHAVIASSSLPGIVVPQFNDGHLLVDGALLDNLPGEVLRAFDCGRLMVVKVSVEEDSAFTYERIPSLREVLRGGLTRRRVRYPGIVEVLFRAALLASIGREQDVMRNADFVFLPPVAQYGMMDFDAIDPIVEAGYRDALDRLEGWRREGRLDGLTRPRAEAAPC